MTRSKFDPTMIPRVKKLGQRGLKIGEAAARLGITSATFARYERTYPEFKKAAAAVRTNSKRWLDLRYARLLMMDEQRILRALAHVRKRKQQALANHAAKFGIEDPSQVRV